MDGLFFFLGAGTCLAPASFFSVVTVASDWVSPVTLGSGLLASQLFESSLGEINGEEARCLEGMGVNWSSASLSS